MSTTTVAIQSADSNTGPTFNPLDVKAGNDVKTLEIQPNILWDQIYGAMQQNQMPKFRQGEKEELGDLTISQWMLVEEYLKSHPECQFGEAHHPNGFRLNMSKQKRKRNWVVDCSKIKVNNVAQRFQLDFTYLEPIKTMCLFWDERNELGAIHVLKALYNNNWIEHLHLEGNILDVETAKHLFVLLQDGTLRSSLSIRTNDICPQALQLIFQGIRSSGLVTHFILNGPVIDDKGAKELARMLKNSQKYCLFDNPFPLLVQRKSKLHSESPKTLRHLDLSHTVINGSQTKKLFKALRTNPSLQSLHLNGCGLSNTDLKSIADYVSQNKVLKELQLRSNLFLFDPANETHLNLKKQFPEIFESLSRSQDMPTHDVKQLQDASLVSIAANSVPVPAVPSPLTFQYPHGLKNTIPGEIVSEEVNQDNPELVTFYFEEEESQEDCTLKLRRWMNSLF